ncbi:hypothetical protein JCM16358_05580 [Halanaerocella petrolearia]
MLRKQKILLLLIVFMVGLTGCQSVEVDLAIKGQGLIKQEVAGVDKSLPAVVGPQDNFQHLYPKQQKLELTAVANKEGWVFSHWTGSITGLEKSITIPLTNSQKLQAVFIPIKKLMQEGSPTEIKRAISRGANLNLRDKAGETPLFYALEAKRSPEIIKLLLESGAKVNVTNEQGIMPLHLALWKEEDPAVIKALLQAGADIYSKLRLTIKKEKMTINKEADGRLISKEFTPLMLAAQSISSPQVIKELIKAGARVNRRLKVENEEQDDYYTGMTPLMIATKYNSCSEIIKALLEMGAEVNSIDKEGFTSLLHAAKSTSNPKVINALVAGGSKVNSNSWLELLSQLFKEGEVTPLMVAARYNQEVEIIERLLELGANINSRGPRGRTALIYAAQYNKNPEVINLLLDYGANPKLQDQIGNLAIDYATKNKALKATLVYKRLRRETQ